MKTLLSTPSHSGVSAAIVAAALAGVALLAGCGEDRKPEAAQPASVVEAPKVAAAPRMSDEDAELLRRARELFQPLPEPEPPKGNAAAKVALGKSLYFDRRLSKGHSVSCNTCHNVASYGVDNLATSPGHRAQLGARNSPTSFNAALHASQFWDGRAADLTEQAKGPILNPVEMAMPEASVAVKTIESIPGYHTAFAEVYAGQAKPVSYQNIADAIASYEATLLTPSPFDAYLRGDVASLSALQKSGLNTFMQTGCVACHAGVGLGGQGFFKFGLVDGPYWKYTGSKSHDEGRYNVTRDPADKYVFRSPTLRNVAVTQPYFHDGSVWSLDKAIVVMGHTQLGKALSTQQVAEIRAFLESLTGVPPQDAMTLPQLPPSGADTRRPDPA